MPDWNNASQNKYYIAKTRNYPFSIYRDNDCMHFLSFQSEEVAKEFLNNFGDIIKKAGDLI